MNNLLISHYDKNRNFENAFVLIFQIPIREKIAKSVNE